MRLADYLRENGIRRNAFAATVGCSPTTITLLCADPPGQWPGRDLALRIREATSGAVTADDFLPGLAPGTPPAPASEAAE